jgi:hypothetical protein
MWNNEWGNCGLTTVESGDEFCQHEIEVDNTIAHSENTS